MIFIPEGNGILSTTAAGSRPSEYRPRHFSQSARAFTLVEIMIVVVIIGLLAAVAVPAFSKVRQNSRAKVCFNNLRQISSAKDQYFLENGGEVTVQLSKLCGPGEYINALPSCPAGGKYSDTLEVDAEPSCASGNQDHLIRIRRLL